MVKKNNKFNLNKWAQVLTIIAGIIAIIQFFSSKSGPDQNLEPNKTLINSEVSASSKVSQTPPSSPTKVSDLKEYSVNKYISKYKDKIMFGITNVEVGKNIVLVNLYIDNQSLKDVKVATFKNMYLIDKDRKQTEAMTFESDDFNNVQPGARAEGKIKFEYPTHQFKGSFTFQTSYWIMDPTAGDTKVAIPFQIK